MNSLRPLGRGLAFIGRALLLTFATGWIVAWYVLCATVLALLIWGMLQDPFSSWGGG